MPAEPDVLLSAFGDEAVPSRQAAEQLTALSALGLRHYSVRFVDPGRGITNVINLTDAELAALAGLHARFGMAVATIGSPLGKVKLRNVADGTNNAYRPFAEYLADEVARTIVAAQRLGTRLVRGFSFYPPRGADREPHFAQTTEQLAAIAARCGAAGLVYGLELEANLMGDSGAALQRLHAAVGSPHLVTIYDGANLSCQNFGPDACHEQYLKMADSQGWMHVKDYRIDPALRWAGHVDEERLRNFVPVGLGDSGYERTFADLKQRLPTLKPRLAALGAPGFFLDLEPHVRGGGQFGGYSGPDGMGIALRALCTMLDRAGLTYSLRGPEDLTTR